MRFLLCLISHPLGSELGSYLVGLGSRYGENRGSDPLGFGARRAVGTGLKEKGDLVDL